VDDFNGRYWGFLLISLIALNCLMVFFLVSGGFFDIECQIVMIGKTDVLLTLLISFTVASFTFNIFEGLPGDKRNKYL